MRFLRPSNLWRPAPRRVSASIALVAYLIAALGFPVPASAGPVAAGRCNCQHNGACGEGCCCCRPMPAAPAAGSCCSGESTIHSCCSKSSVVEPENLPPSSMPDASKGVRWHFGLSAPTCGGDKTLWITAGAVLPPSPPLVWVHSLSLVGRVCCTDSAAVSFPFCPPDPPPRSLLG
jgi:hypothetical protein